MVHMVVTLDLSRKQTLVTTNPTKKTGGTQTSTHIPLAGCKEQGPRHGRRKWEVSGVGLGGGRSFAVVVRAVEE
jgi:hypothetical protein